MAELTTFGTFSNTMEQAENNPTPAPTFQPTPTPIPEPTPVPDLSNQNPAPIPTPEPVPVPIPEPAPVENNVSSFSLGEPEPANPAPIPTPQQPVAFNLDDEIKKVDRKEILKKLGVTDFAIEIDEHLSKGGHAVDYLNAKAVDYNKVSDEDLIKDALRKEFVGFSEAEIGRLYARKYPDLDSEVTGDKEDAELQLRADAYKVRQAKIADQQKFKVPETPILQKNEAYEQWEQNKTLQAQQVEQLNTYYSTHEATQKLNESKRVTISLGEGIAPFNFVIDKPEMITQAFTDGGKTWGRLTTTPQGEPDVAKQQLIALFSYNPQKFIQDIFKYGQGMGVKGLVDEGQNAQKPQAAVADMNTNKVATYSVGKFGDRARN